MVIVHLIMANPTSIVPSDASLTVLTIFATTITDVPYQAYRLFKYVMAAVIIGNAYT
jgi:hypothetical protein